MNDWEDDSEDNMLTERFLALVCEKSQSIHD